MKIVIAHQTWEVEKVSGHDPKLYVNGEECTGTAWLAHFKIYISADLKGDRALRTIRHEVCHAFIFSTQAVRPESWSEEDLCDFMSIYCQDITKYSQEIYNALFLVDRNLMDEEDELRGTPSPICPGI